jgi:putative tryptophan/tyrosine transport system substrate-binding protein
MTLRASGPVARADGISPGRRDLLWLAAGVALGWWPARAEDRIKQIGFVEAGSLETKGGLFDAFRDGLRALGWVDGRNVAIVQRWAEGRDARLPDLVDEVIWSGIDVLVTGAATAAIAAGKVTRTIPVVLVGEPDPVAFGLADSLSHPGGNVTGVSSLSYELVNRQFAMLQETVPNLRRLAALAISQQPSAEQRWRYVQTCASRRNLALTELEAATEEALERTFVVLKNNPVDALWVAYDGSTPINPARIVALATAARLPAIYPSRRFPAAGGLIAYGPDFTDLFRRAAPYVDLILKGAKPGDLPFGTPVKFELSVNPKAAKALGLSIPQKVLASANEVIEANVPSHLPAAVTPAEQKTWTDFNRSGD